MIAILQIDAASLTHLGKWLSDGNLPNLAALCSRGAWYHLESPAAQLEGSAAYSLYTGTGLGLHGLYYPWLWSAGEQRVRFFDDYPAPEAVWEKLSWAGLRSLIIDPYEMRPPQKINGIYLSGWQFKNRVVLRSRSIPPSMHRSLEREFGRPPDAEEVYGRPTASELTRLRHSLLAGPARAAIIVEPILKREPFDLVWITLPAAHLAGHRFFDVSRFSEEIKLQKHPELQTALRDIYQSLDEAVGRLIAALPERTDIIVVSPSGMGPNTSRSHLLPGMLNAVLAEEPMSQKRAGSSVAGSSLWRIRAAFPPKLRGWIAKTLPDSWAVELTARLELRAVNWAKTRAFTLPCDDAGYVRLNLRGRERDGIVEPADVDALLETISTGLMTFRNPDGTSVVKQVVSGSDLGFNGPAVLQLPDLVVYWNEQPVSPLSHVVSSRFGKIASPGWGTGRTGCHNGDAWALLVPGRSVLNAPAKPPHLVDIATTACAVLGVDNSGLPGQPLLTPI